MAKLFKIDFLIADTKLPDMLRLLAANGALAVNPVPVGNAEEAANGEVRRVYKGGSPHEMFYNYLLENNIKLFRADDIKAFLNKLGASTASYSHHINRMVEKGWVKGVSSKTQMGNDWHVQERKK